MVVTFEHLLPIEVDRETLQVGGEIGIYQIYPEIEEDRTLLQLQEVLVKERPCGHALNLVDISIMKMI